MAHQRQQLRYTLAFVVDDGQIIDSPLFKPVLMYFRSFNEVDVCHCRLDDKGPVSKGKATQMIVS